MRHVIAPIALLFVTGLTAQITIGPADMPSAGDTVRYRTTDASAVDPAATEAGFIWDMGMLVPDLEGADTCVAVSTTPFLYQLYFNNAFIYPEWDADYAQRGQSFDFQGQLTVTDVYDYYKKDATGFRNVGFGANINGVPASVRRMPVDWVHRFPMNYGDMDTSYSEFTLDVPTLFSFTQQQTRYNEVDGWGTLYLPADTFEVLRVKSTLVRFDSVYIEQFGQSFTFPEPETIEYKWIAQDMDEPVLQIVTTAGQISSARFFYEEDISTGIAVTAAQDFSAYPNPANEAVTFTGVQGGIIVLHDATGRVVRTQRVGTGVVVMDVADLAPGNYTATMQGTTVTLVAQVIVQR